MRRNADNGTERRMGLFSGWRKLGIGKCRMWSFCLLLISGCVGVRSISAQAIVPQPQGSPSSMAPQSTFFSTAAEESYSTYQLPGDGDLWPSCWSDDGNLYTANGDGAAFTGGRKRFDMAVSVIRGMPPHLTGSTLATNVGTDWSGPSYNRKPTGMLCIHGTVYLAFQNLNLSNFTDVPAASIARSKDHGVTWTWDKTTPMFGMPKSSGDPKAYKFTTIFFLDFGKDSGNAIDRYVYAYGLDYSWRGQKYLYLARVPDNKVQTRSAWEFFTGLAANGQPRWSSEILAKQPVLTDARQLCPVRIAGACPANQSVIGQGGVVYDAPLKRYIFASWSCATHEFYEAPQPWGPWRHFLSKDFGAFRPLDNRGQYGTSIPSKFISADGKTFYLESNVCCGGNSYTFSLRKIYLETYTPSQPENGYSSTNLADAPGSRAISKSTEFGSLCGPNCSDRLNDGSPLGSEDDYDGEAKAVDWWGYIWPRTYNFDNVVYETGEMFPDGGWYNGNLHVQVRRDFQWVDAPGKVRIEPTYPYGNASGNHGVRPHATYLIRFSATCGDGIRIIGTPGGSGYFTSISRLGVYYGGSLAAPAPASACDRNAAGANTAGR